MLRSEHLLQWWEWSGIISVKWWVQSGVICLNEQQSLNTRRRRMHASTNTHKHTHTHTHIHIYIYIYYLYIFIYIYIRFKNLSGALQYVHPKTSREIPYFWDLRFCSTFFSVSVCVSMCKCIQLHAKQCFIVSGSEHKIQPTESWISPSHVWWRRDANCEKVDNTLRK